MDPETSLPPGGPPDATLWWMFADISQSLQLLSASIKAAISSLLDTTIIWDRSSQHEFMESINQSVDRLYPLALAMTLAMKSESGAMELVLERSDLQEIVSRAADALQRDGVETTIRLSLPPDGKPAYVDYDYLRIALRMLLEALVAGDGPPVPSLHIRAEEEVTHWLLHLEGDFPPPARALVAWLDNPSQGFPSPREVKAEHMLKAFTAARLLEQQQIELRASPDAGPDATLTLVVPCME